MDLVKLTAGVVAATALVAAGSAAARPPTKSQGRAVARAVNLKASDMPGFDATPADKPTAQERADDERLARCAGTVPPSKAVTTGSSPTFTRGDDKNFEIVGSSVRVLRSAAVVRKDLRAWRTQRARACLRQQVLDAADQAPIVSVDATTLRTGVRGVIGYRFTTHLEASDSREPLYSDLFLFGTRYAEALVIVSSHPDPAATAQEDRLLGILKTRLDTRLNPNTLL